MKQIPIAAIFPTIITIFVLAGCAINEASKPDYNESLSLCSLPEGNKPKDECTCLIEAINALNLFAEKMNNSRYAIHYQAMSQQKISIIKKHADKIGCKYPVS